MDNGLLGSERGPAEGQPMPRVLPGAGSKRGRLFARSHRHGVGGGRFDSWITRGASCTAQRACPWRAFIHYLETQGKKTIE